MVLRWVNSKQKNPHQSDMYYVGGVEGYTRGNAWDLGSNPTRHRVGGIIFLVLEDIQSGFKTVGTKQSWPLVLDP